MDENSVDFYTEPVGEVDRRLVGAINNLLQELGTERRTTLRDLLETSRSSEIIVVKSKGGASIVGMGTIYMVRQLGRSYCVIEDVVISSSYRGRGLFMLLMDELERVAYVEYGVARVELHTSRSDAKDRYLGRGYYVHEGSQILRKSLR